MLRCPASGEKLHLEGDALVSQSSAYRYRLSETGIPLFAESALTPEAKVQRAHYDRIAGVYVENLAYPHTQEYTRYLDQALLRAIADSPLDSLAEICCGRGEAFRLLQNRFRVGVGVDISPGMLEVGRRELPGENVMFVQGDATRLPLADNLFECVLMLGGIHHVNHRARLFAEIFRVLKPGGILVWREPVNDFFIWRWLRTVVYRLSPTLDDQTEHPLQYAETLSQLEAAGFQPELWRYYGFLGFMLLMNSDVLVFNRLFRFVPGIRWLTRAMVSFDDWAVGLPLLKRAGLQVIGVAAKTGKRST